MDYTRFKNDFERSGLTQKRYGHQKGMSPSMVSYYLKKAREQDYSSTTFLPVEITSTTEIKVIKITTSSGVKIEIPS